MDRIKLTGFADEIASDFEEQCMRLSELGMNLITLRSINGKNILDFTYDEFQKDSAGNAIKTATNIEIQSEFAAGIEFDLYKVTPILGFYLKQQFCISGNSTF